MHIFVTIQSNSKLKLKKILLHSSSECCMSCMKEFFYSKHVALFDILKSLLCFSIDILKSSNFEGACIISIRYELCV